jgi:hypothetical protein
MNMLPPIGMMKSNTPSNKGYSIKPIMMNG